MSYFIKNGSTYTVSSHDSLNISDVLPVGNYIVKFNDFTKSFFLDQVDDFTSIKKTYGNTTRHANRIIQTFKDRSSSTGVMLTGEKGSGKTLLARTISLELAKENMPTIIINEPFHGDIFNQFIQNIEQKCVIMFDEFEKVYDSEEQEGVLTLLDGVFQQNKLFIITCNDKWRVDTHMRNRPGRIYYMIDFKGLEQEFIVEYCKDNLKNLNHIDGVVNISALFSEFNFDMLKALIEEMNRYDEPANLAIEMLNAKPMFNGNTTYNITVTDKDNVKVPMYSEDWSLNPLQKDNFSLSTDFPDGKDDIMLPFNITDLVKADADSLTFTNGENYTVVFTRVKSKDFDFTQYVKQF